MLDILLKNKVNEIKQIREDIRYVSTDYTNNDWQDDIIRFCLDVDGCFEDLSEVEVADKQIHKCTNIMRVISKHKTLNEAQKLQSLAYNIAQDFKLLYAQEKEEWY